MTAAMREDCILGVVGVLERDGRLLLIQRSDLVRAPRMWCFPGGAIEPGESPAEAIVREFQEEVGLTVVAERRLWSWLREDGGLHLEWWLVRHLRGELELNLDEVRDAKWMTDDDVRAEPAMIANNLVFLDRYRGGLL
jgi:8-oxo-dGTP diphosphatase